MVSPIAASVSRWSDGRMLAVNDAWLALTGLSREAVIGRTTVELGHWTNEEARARFMNDPPDAGGTYSLRLRDGLMHRVRLNKRLLASVPEPLLLVQMTEAAREFEAEQARIHSEQTLRQVNLGLQRQVELHAALEKLACVGYWTDAAGGRDTQWSQGLRDIAGLAPDQPTPRWDDAEGVHPEDREAWRAARAAMDGREFEYRWRRPDGQQRWLRSHFSRTSVAGNPQTEFGVVQDITAEREAKERLAEQLALLQNIAARVPGMMYQARLRPDGTSVIAYVNDVARSMLELEPAELEKDARTLFDRVHPDDRPEVIASLARSAQQLTAWRANYRVCLPSGGLRWYQVEALPQREADGSVVWHGFSTDVTDARMAAQQLERQHRMLEAVRLAQTVFIEADDKLQAFEALLQALLSVTGSTYGLIGEVLFDESGAPYLRTNAITNIAWDEPSRLMFQSQVGAGMTFRSPDTFFGHALKTGEVVIANDPANDPRAGGVPSWGWPTSPVATARTTSIFCSPCWARCASW